MTPAVLERAVRVGRSVSQRASNALDNNGPSASYIKPIKGCRIDADRWATDFLTGYRPACTLQG